jgi:cob(I)alamin adenosyltransferase
MKIYTKTGDDGMTGLLGPGRLPKDHLRIEAYGTVDELNATIGVARASGLEPGLDQALALVQEELFAAGASLADPDPEGRFHRSLTAERVERLEQAIDRMEEELPPLTQFILPGGTPTAAQLHLARTVCRRAERLVVQLARQEVEFVAVLLIPYLNRLSDYLFVLSRLVNQRAGVPDVPWRGLDAATP